MLSRLIPACVVLAIVATPVQAQPPGALSDSVAAVHNGLPANVAVGHSGVVASVQPLATQAGIAAFRDGGNAVDAAIATALMLGVVDSHNSGLGGGCFILIRQPNGNLLAIDGREMAPAAADRDMFLRDGRAAPNLSITGPLAVGAPGALAAYQMAMRQCGRLTLASRMRPAAEIAANGHPIDRVMARNIRETADAIRQFPATRKILLNSEDKPLEEGDTLVQPDLAATYRAIADNGPKWFYGGPYAEKLDAWMQSSGGILRKADMSNYRAIKRTPIQTTYRGFTIVGFPPPSSGGVHVAEMLNILEYFDLKQLHAEDRVTFYHVIGEAMKLAFADRAHWLGDADYAPVPRGLVDKAYARQLAAQIRMDQSIEVPSHGLPPDWQSNVYGKHTTHIAAADDEGYWVAITATINTSFGSKVVIPGTGLLLNNEMDDFSAQPGVPNAFGLIGNRNNAVAPGKRPLSSMSPTIVLQNGQPILTMGAAGGPKIITQVLLTIIQAIDLELPIDQCIEAPRWHHQWRPDQLMFESTFPKSIAEQLAARGHKTGWLESAGIAQAIAATTNGMIAVHDPRVPGAARGFERSPITPASDGSNSAVDRR